MLEFMMIVGRLKRVPRTGWVIRKVENVESVADHMYRMALMTFLVQQNDSLKRDRCMKIALVHDLAESLVGDIAPADGISKEEKHRREKEAMDKIISLVSEDVGKEIYALWEEYETQSSEEAKLVKDLDRFEMVLQAFEYEQLEKRPGQLQDFFESTKGKFQHSQVQSWVQELYEMRGKSSKDNGT